MKKQKFDDIEYSFQVVNEDFKTIVERKFKLSMVEFDGTLQFETTTPDYIYNKAKKIWPEDYFEETIGDKVLFISFKGNTGIKRY